MFDQWRSVMLGALTESRLPQGLARRFGTDEMSWNSMAVLAVGERIFLVWRSSRLNRGK
jgi:hypothetical protein